MTPQTIFDEVVRHAFKQRAPARGECAPLCRYRADDGNKCFVGALIPDEIYVVGMDGAGGVSNLIRGYENTLPAWFGTHRELLEDLQQIHDNAAHVWGGADTEKAFLQTVVRGLDGMAEEYGIISTVLDDEVAKYSLQTGTNLR